MQGQEHEMLAETTLRVVAGAVRCGAHELLTVIPSYRVLVLFVRFSTLPLSLKYFSYAHLL